MPSKGRSGLEETPGYLGGRLRTHTGHGTFQLVAINVSGQKRKNGPNIAAFNDHIMLSVRVMRRLVVHADSL